MDGSDKSVAEVQAAFAGTGRARDEEIHVGVDGTSVIDGPEWKECAGECDYGADEDKVFLLWYVHGAGGLTEDFGQTVIDGFIECRQGLFFSLGFDKRQGDIFVVCRPCSVALFCGG